MTEELSPTCLCSPGHAPTAPFAVVAASQHTTRALDDKLEGRIFDTLEEFVGVAPDAVHLHNDVTELDSLIWMIVVEYLDEPWFYRLDSQCRPVVVCYDVEAELVAACCLADMDAEFPLGWFLHGFRLLGCRLELLLGLLDTRRGLIGNHLHGGGRAVGPAAHHCFLRTGGSKVQKTQGWRTRTDKWSPWAFET